MTSDAIGKFLINSKQLLKDNNEAVLQCEFLNFYRNIYGPFKPDENGFSRFSQLLTAFSEFFILLPPSNVSKTIVINRKFDTVKLQGRHNILLMHDACFVWKDFKFGIFDELLTKQSLTNQPLTNQPLTNQAFNHL